MGGHVVWSEPLSRNKVFNHFHPNSTPASRGWSVFEWSRWPCSISRGLCVKINYKINQRPPPAPANCTKAGFTAYSQKLVPNQIKQPAARRETKYSKLGVTTRQSFGQTKKEWPIAHYTYQTHLWNQFTCPVHLCSWGKHLFKKRIIFLCTAHFWWVGFKRLAK